MFHFKVHKFSKHTLSNCTYWQDSKNLDHLNLEDILNNADEEGLHVLLEDDGEEHCYVEINNSQYEGGTSTVSYIQEYQESEENGEIFEVAESTEEIQYEESEEISYVTQHPNQADHAYGSQSKYKSVIDNKQKGNTKTAIFNLNLGEFTVDEDATPQPEEYNNTGS